MQPHHDHDGWRIAYRPHTALGGPGYVRAYGWGWLATPGVLMAIVATGALLLNHRGPAVWAALGTGVALLLLGIVLNGVSERRRMRLVMARCLDAEIRVLGRPSRVRPSGHAVRVLMTYEWNGRHVEATPGRWGYVVFAGATEAEGFIARLRAASVPLLMDPDHPTRAAFVDRPG